MRRLLAFCAILGTVLMVGAAGSLAQNAIYGVTSRATLAGNDTADWGSIDPRFLYKPAPVRALSAGGAVVTVDAPPTFGHKFIAMLVQSYSWGGNFALGDVLLGLPMDVYRGPLIISFPVPVYGAGAQINADHYGLFDATVEAFDGADNSLGLFAFNGLQVTRWADDSAPFVGVVSEQANIAKLVFANSSHPVLINRLDLVTTPPVMPTTDIVEASPGTGPTAGGGLSAVTCNKTTELAMPEGIFIHGVDTDGFSATIFYNYAPPPTGGSAPYTLYMPTTVDVPVPMEVWVNGSPGALADIEGEQAKNVTADLTECTGFDAATDSYKTSAQWIVQAKLKVAGGGGGGADQGGGGGQGGGDQGGGGNQDPQAQMADFEGFVAEIGAADLLLDKEGSSVRLTVTAQTEVLLNEQPATFADIQAGDKVKASYDSNTDEAVQLMIER